MVVAGEKTQLLVLSQSAADSADCAIKVAGKVVQAADHLKLLGVTFDRLFHFGAHCRSLRARVRPRTMQLRKLTGRSWGLEERQLRTVASGYVRGALEHAAAAWLPATPPSHVELLEREMRAAARAITGCPMSTPAHAVMAEAGLVPVSARRTTLAAKFLAKAHAMPEGDPLRAVAEADFTHRLKSVTGWREVGREAWQAAGIAPPPPRSSRCYPTEPPRGRWPRAPMSVLICPSGHHANKTPRQRQRAGPPSSTWPPCPSEPRGCGRTGRRTGESGTAALERTSTGRTGPPPSSDPRPAASAPASGPS